MRAVLRRALADTFNVGTATKISQRRGWQNQFSDIYVSNPPTGAKKNEHHHYHGPEFFVRALRDGLFCWTCAGAA